jgi:hypothetical protein
MLVFQAITESKIDHRMVNLDVAEFGGRKFGRLIGPVGPGINELRGVWTDWLPLAEAVNEARRIADNLRISKVNLIDPAHVF